MSTETYTHALGRLNYSNSFHMSHQQQFYFIKSMDRPWRSGMSFSYSSRCSSKFAHKRDTRKRRNEVQGRINVKESNNVINNNNTHIRQDLFRTLKNCHIPIISILEKSSRAHCARYHTDTE